MYSLYSLSVLTLNLMIYWAHVLVEVCIQLLPFKMLELKFDLESKTHKNEKYMISSITTLAITVRAAGKLHSKRDHVFYSLFFKFLLAKFHFLHHAQNQQVQDLIGII